MECIKGDPIPTDTQYFSYKSINTIDGLGFTVKDKDKCVAYLIESWNDTSDEGKQAANTLCSGNVLDDGWTIKNELIEGGSIPSSEYETAGIEVGYIIINNVEVKDKDKCVAYLIKLWNDTSDEAKQDASTLCSGNALDGGWTIKDELIEGGSIPSSEYETAGIEVDYIIINNVEVKDKDKCVTYLIESWNDASDQAKQAANTECSGNALDGGLTIKDEVQQGYIPSSDYETAGLEVTSEPYIIEITITEYNKEGGLDVVIPSKIDGKKVVWIGTNSFREKGITSIIIPNTVTNIGSYAFYINKLTSITIPSSVKTIGESAFEYNQLTELIIPSNITKIGERAFAKNQEMSITNNSIIENSSDVWNKIIGAGGCGNFYVDSITDNIIKISQSTVPC